MAEKTNVDQKTWPAISAGCNRADANNEFKAVKTASALLGFGHAPQEQITLEGAFLEKEEREIAQKIIEIIQEPREQKILKMRFGLGEYDRSHTFQEIGDEMGLTGARIVQIYNKIMNKLRHKRFRLERLDEAAGLPKQDFVGLQKKQRRTI
ncbi:MAG: hypothetical protein COU31_01870 [Candidatus Magasanikbacteria bacterium CG10_big_fil_rev_8_21_14_0_10_40_10]|uniref:RNA polymerase sigma-70 region 4 domain-containing protein n=1 Tax=Candidatus Magasanikbacteria bacterium CG10_big_fil_rev_8_21_14_0_10_40_10 TaxID=1974648 RepID=A0A2M6W4G4_9BACT|nr:MAG: hypothetical protein COU31_01870 [Candidatus Magasanikbacteria bacterium CG10_big_fil_rev_8_21_14_0_10_40_10]